MEWLLGLDRAILLSINGAHTSWMDATMVFVSEKWVWVPAYAFVFYLLVRQFGMKQALLAALFCGLAVVLADQLASSILKPVVGRLRPCHEPGLSGLLWLSGKKCGGTFGFASSHAANFAAMAAFLAMAFARLPYWQRVLFFIPLLLVAYSRVYLGVHYPLDVICGAGIGTFLGWALHLAYRSISPHFDKVIHR